MNIDGNVSKLLNIHVFNEYKHFVYFFCNIPICVTINEVLSVSDDNTR